MKFCLVTIILFTVLFYFIGCGDIKPVKIEGSAMLPTLQNGNRIFLTKDFDNIERGDIISFLYPKDTNKWFIKRVIGLPNETIEIKNGKVFVNGEELKESYIDQDYNQTFGNYYPKVVPKDNYFVLGDNRDNSSDSRVWGTVPKSLIQGKFWYKYGEAKK